MVDILEALIPIVTAFLGFWFANAQAEKRRKEEREIFLESKKLEVYQAALSKLNRISIYPEKRDSISQSLVDFVLDNYVYFSAADSKKLISTASSEEKNIVRAVEHINESFRERMNIKSIDML